VAITGDGSVLRILVTEGRQVNRGDVLAELVDGVLPGYTASTKETGISSAAILYDIAVQPGQQVSRGQVLATLHPLAQLQVEADINELDLTRIQVGDAVQVELIGLKASAPINGTVTAISALSHTETGDAEYKVYVSFPVNESVREGMSATGYLVE
jgi:multidrug resistance efflux pump